MDGNNDWGHTISTAASEAVVVQELMTIFALLPCRLGPMGRLRESPNDRISSTHNSRSQMTYSTFAGPLLLLAQLYCSTEIDKLIAHIGLLTRSSWLLRLFGVERSEPRQIILQRITISSNFVNSLFNRNSEANNCSVEPQRSAASINHNIY